MPLNSRSGRKARQMKGMMRPPIRPLTLAVALFIASGTGQFAELEAADMQTPPSSRDFAAGFRKGRVTGYPLPRFVSLKASSAHMRVGPSTDYPTVWLYSARGLPLEIIEEYGNWRRVRDQEGTSGWMFAPLLSGRRTAVTGPWLDKPIPLRRGPAGSASLVARLDPGVRLNLHHCDGTWCEVTLQSRDVGGYILQGSLWGVYPGERLD